MQKISNIYIYMYIYTYIVCVCVYIHTHTHTHTHTLTYAPTWLHPLLWDWVHAKNSTVYAPCTALPQVWVITLSSWKSGCQLYTLLLGLPPTTYKALNWSSPVGRLTVVGFKVASIGLTLSEDKGSGTEGELGMVSTIYLENSLTQT